MHMSAPTSTVRADAMPGAAAVSVRYGSRARGWLGRTWPLLGPAFVAAVAYVDPGNFATNFAAGASYGYGLLWVIVAANLMAMLIQTLTAKLGVATGRDLASLCREQLPRPVVWGLWGQAEAVAVATDLAEVVGGAIALYLLFGVPLPIGGLITAGVAFGLLGAQSRGYRPFETVITGLLAWSGSALPTPCSAPASTRRAWPPAWSRASPEPTACTPQSNGSAPRSGDDGTAPVSAAQRRLLRVQRTDVVLAMGAAGIVNAAMLVIAAQLFTGGSTPVSSLEQVHAGLGAQLGSSAALAFAIALLASGMAASAVGTYARAGRHGRVPTPAHPAAATPCTDHHPRPGRPRRRRRPNRRAGLVAGRALLRHSLCLGPAGVAHGPP